MKKLLKYIVVIIFLTIISYYFIVTQNYCNFKTFLDFYLRFLQTTFSFVIAYLLYDRFGTSKKILDKQNEIIIEFIQNYRSFGIYCYIFDGNKVINTYIKPGKKISSRFDKKYMNRLILFPAGTLGHPKLHGLNKLIENPLFPVELVPDISTLNFYSLTAEIDNFDRNKFIFFSFEKIDNFNELNQKEFMKPNNEKLTLDVFLSKIVNSVVSIEDWINRESSIKIKLNLE